MADAQTPTPAQLLAFLHGAGEIDGVSFGDRHPTLPGAFWWRRHLPILAAQAPAQQAEPVGEVVLFGGDLKEIAWREGKLPPVGAKLYTQPAPSHMAVMQQALDAIDAEFSDEWECNSYHPKLHAARAALFAALSATMEKPA